MGRNWKNNVAAVSMEIWTVHSYVMRCYIYLDILQWLPQKLTVSKPCTENTGRSSFCEVPAEDGAILVVHHFCTAPVLTVWPAEALLSISYLAKSASHINLPIKRGQVPLPEVGKGASEEPPASRSVGAVLLTGGGMQCTISSQQSKTWKTSVYGLDKPHEYTHTAWLAVYLAETKAGNTLICMNIHDLCFLS